MTNSASRDPLFDLYDQVVIITGGGGALPEAIARGLGERGARIALVNRTLGKAEQVARDIRARGGRAAAFQGDVTDAASLEAACAEIVNLFGRVDHLINGAGGNRPGATATTVQQFFEMPVDELRAVLDLNLLGAVLASQVFGKAIASNGRGSILNFSSMAAVRPLTRVVGYGAAKSALENVTRWLAATLARELSPQIRVNAIAPGFFVGEQNRSLLMNEAGELTPRGQSIISLTPMGRFGEPAELVSTVIWLLSPGAKFVTGIVVPVDGGFSAYGGV